MTMMTTKTKTRMMTVMRAAMMKMTRTIEYVEA